MKKFFLIFSMITALLSFNAYADETIITNEPVFDCDVKIIIDDEIIAESPISMEDAYIIKETDFANIGDAVKTVDSDGDKSKIIIEGEYKVIDSDCIGNEEELNNTIKENEYPNATYIWNYFKDAGYSDEVVAGIIGNAMVEVGGWEGNIATMNLDVTNNGKTYYGTWQWNKRLYPDVVGLNIEDQCEFLLNTIEYEFDNYGKCSGHSYNSFLNIDNPSSAALAFAKTYERCSKNTYSRRQRCAEVAYNYFSI